MSNKFNSLLQINAETIINTIINNKIVLVMFVIIELMIASFLLFFTNNKKNIYHSEQVELTPKIKVPKPVGQGQYGTGWWLNKKDYNKVFKCNVIDRNNPYKETSFEYVRIAKLITGTYNQDLNYSIYYKTNKNDYRLLRDNLNTQVNNYIDFSNLELEVDEYVTEFKADFGTVDVGFETVIDPYIFVKVNSTVQNDDVFTNNTRIEGYNKTYMVWDEDYHTTKVYEKEVEIKKLPKTGM